ncbi:MAG: DUF1194 domain-containing protein [Hyphomicrobiaceae bacterium]|jgi:hypothetical protein
MLERILLAAAIILTTVVGCAITSLQAQAETKVDLELVLLADASGSIDSTELTFQRQGYASALVHPEVQRAIAGGAYRRIALTYVEWGNDQWQDVVVPWTIIDGLPSAQAFGATLMERPRRAHGGNAIGSALAAATRLIEGNDIRGERKVIDLSGDSANSWSGIPIPVARAEALAHGIVINGLAIACRDQGCSGRPMLYNLEDAFERDIIGGPGSFVVTADSSTSFEDAVRKKLILEISAAPIGSVRLARGEQR